MKNNSEKISANEINRFVYCPYQWYYNRKYGSKAIREIYQTLNLGPSEQESHFIKGLRFHHHYYRSYRIKKVLQIFMLLVSAAAVVWWVMLR